MTASVLPCGPVLGGQLDEDLDHRKKADSGVDVGLMVFPVGVVGADGNAAVGNQRAVGITGDENGGQIPGLCLPEHGQIPVCAVGGQHQKDGIVADGADQGGEQAFPLHQDGRVVQAV